MGDHWKYIRQSRTPQIGSPWVVVELKSINKINMKKEEKYLKVLNSVIDEEQSREWMQKPFNAGDKTMATNGWIMVATPKVGEYTDRSSKVGFVYPYVKTMDLPITIESLRNIISQVPMIDGVIDCDCCNGTGEG